MMDNKLETEEIYTIQHVNNYCFDCEVPFSCPKMYKEHKGHTILWKPNLWKSLKTWIRKLKDSWKEYDDE